MKAHFFELSDGLARELRAGEVLLCSFNGERSDFIRFNRGGVRQAGTVEQRYVSLRLIRERRHAGATLAVGGGAEDSDALRDALARLRDVLPGLPEDPWLLIAGEPRSTFSERRGSLAPAEEIALHVTRNAKDLDLVGIYAGGTMHRGFANSLGQRNWHEVDSFNFDWSLYREAGQAVKAGHAGFEWRPEEWDARLHRTADQLDLLGLPPRPLATGEYRAYLAPRALEELAGLLSWGGYSARARATRQTPLLRMQHGQALSPKITLTENIRDGIAPGFQSEGFVKPDCVTLIERGLLGEALVSPRSAQEYGLPTNAASGSEAPESIELAPGELPEAGVVDALGTGLYISNLWYLNFSDRPAGRITGMTRFATFWVEGGRFLAPVAPMRFDDSIYRMLGENLLDLTRERELLLDPSTYGERSTSSARLPGALLGALRFTL